MFCGGVVSLVLSAFCVAIFVYAWIEFKETSLDIKEDFKKKRIAKSTAEASLILCIGFLLMGLFFFYINTY